MFTEHTWHKEDILGRDEDAKGRLFIRSGKVGSKPSREA